MYYFIPTINHIYCLVFAQVAELCDANCIIKMLDKLRAKELILNISTSIFQTFPIIFDKINLYRKKK